MSQSVVATYEIMVDLNGDLAFTDAGGDISTYVKRIEVTRGMAGPMDFIARSATMTVVLANNSGKFSPEGGSALSGFQQGRVIRVRMTYGGVTTQLYIGKIDHIEPMTGTRGPRETTVKCDGYLAKLMDEEVRTPVLQNATTDQALLQIMAGVSEYPPGTSGFFLGVSGFAELGVTTILRSTTDYVTADSGSTTFAFAGDNWRDGYSAYRALYDLMEAERGWVYESRDGKLTYKSRRFPFLDLQYAVDATLTGAQLRDAAYKYGDHLINSVEMNYYPRLLGSSLTDTLGMMSGATLVPTNKAGHAETPVTVTVRFDDGNGNKISGINPIVPVPYVDFTADLIDQGRYNPHQKPRKVHDMTPYVGIAMAASGDKVDITFTNTSDRRKQGGQDLYVQSGFTVRGQKMTDFNKQQFVYEDSTSVGAYGRKRLPPITARMLQDTHVVEDIATGIVAARKDPTGSLESVTFRANGSDALMQQARDRTIADRVALSETQTGINWEHFLVGEKHVINSHRDHLVLWTLLPKSQQAFWILGVSGYGELGNTTWLGF